MNKKEKQKPKESTLSAFYFNYVEKNPSTKRRQVMQFTNVHWCNSYLTQPAIGGFSGGSPLIGRFSLFSLNSLHVLSCKLEQGY